MKSARPLKRARAAGAEHLLHAIGGLAERIGLRQVAAESRQIRDVQNVENLGQHHQAVAIANLQRLAHAQVLRGKAVP